MRTYVITEISNFIIAVSFKEGVPTVIHAYDKGEEALLGNVYIGRIRNIVKNINSAFIEIKKDLPCYYPLDDAGKLKLINSGSRIKAAENDLVLVQVEKDAIKTKAPSLTSEISLTGNYVVFVMDGKGTVNVSSKIDDASFISTVREELNELVEGTGFSIIVRTAAKSAGLLAIKDEALKYKKIADDITMKMSCRPAYTCLYKKEPEYIADLREEKLEPGDKIVTDIPEVYEFISDALPVTKDVKHPEEGKPLLNFYDDKLLSLSKLYSLEKHINEALSEKVWLKSGAYLVIQPTEALTVIDVNTGKFDKPKSNKEENFLKINLEAAKEIYRQLSLRNISGIIIVDFINLKSDENNRILDAFLKEEAGKDRVPTFFVDRTKLGLAEITRKKIKRPLGEICKGIDDLYKSNVPAV